MTVPILDAVFGALGYAKKPVIAQTNAADTTPPATYSELSQNYPGMFLRWRAPARVYNPVDDLVGKRGLDVYEQMRRDDAVKGALKFKKAAVLSPGWEIVSASEHARDQKIADYVTHVLMHLDPLYGAFDDILTEQLTALDFGFSIAELILAPITSGDFKGKLGLRTIKVRRPHEFIFDLDEYDNLKPDGIRQSMLDKGMPVEKFLIYSYQREFGNFQGVSDLRSAYEPWWLKTNLWRWAAIYAERYAIPIPLGKFPAGHKSAAEVAAFQTMLANIQSNTSMTFPDTFDVVLQEAGGRGVNILQWLFEECNLAIARAVLVPSKLGLTAEPATGTYSQARKHFDAFMLVVDELQHDIANDVVNAQLIPRLVAWNFPKVETPPVFRWLPIPDEQLSQLMTAWMQAVAMGIVKSTPQDETYIRSVTSFPEREITEAEEAASDAKIEADAAKMQAEADATIANPAAALNPNGFGGGGGGLFGGGGGGGDGAGWGQDAWGGDQGAAASDDETPPELQGYAQYGVTLALPQVVIGPEGALGFWVTVAGHAVFIRLAARETLQDAWRRATGWCAQAEGLLGDLTAMQADPSGVPASAATYAPDDLPTVQRKPDGTLGFFVGAALPETADQDRPRVFVPLGARTVADAYARVQAWAARAQIELEPVRHAHVYAAHAHEQKLDFAQLAAALDALELDATDRWTEVLTRARDVALATVQKKYEVNEITPAFVRDFDLKYRAEMTRIVREALTEGYKLGADSGERALLRVATHARPHRVVGIAPEQALKYFEEKSFWVTGVVKTQLKDKLQNIILNAMKTGQGLSLTIQQMRNAFEPYLGDSSALRARKREQVTPYRLATIIRTNLTDAYNQGMKKNMEAQIANGNVIAWRSVAVLDDRTTPVCEKLHGQYFRPDTEETELCFPPRHFNCRSIMVPVTKAEGPVRFITRARVDWALRTMEPGFGGKPA